jgi:HD-GYP domain-containing protein (c-di-GMP phosphodiesterase class II)
MDGSGCPYGARGEKILMEARNLAVADAVEAIDSHCPYRASWGIDNALAETMLGRGGIFDPDVVDVCVRFFREEGFRFLSNSLCDA